MGNGKLWEEIEWRMMEEGAAIGLTSEQIQKAMSDAGYDRTVGAVRHQRVIMGNPVGLVSKRKTIEQQDAKFCVRMLKQIDLGNETCGLQLVNGRWSKAYAGEAVQQRCGNDGPLQSSS